MAKKYTISIINKDYSLDIFARDHITAAKEFVDTIWYEEDYDRDSLWNYGVTVNVTEAATNETKMIKVSVDGCDPNWVGSEITHE